MPPSSSQPFGPQDPRNPEAERGSQHRLQRAVERRPEVLQPALQPVLGLERGAGIAWKPPLAEDGYREYRDEEALRRAGIDHLPERSLGEFWPRRGPDWDALGVTSRGESIFVAAGSHAAELASPGTRSTGDSLAWIRRSLEEVRRQYAPGSEAEWRAEIAVLHATLELPKEADRHSVHGIFPAVRQLVGDWARFGRISGLRTRASACTPVEV